MCACICICVWVYMYKTNDNSGTNFGLICRDDQILFNGLLFYLANMVLPQASYLPMWRSDGAVLIALLHIGPVEFLYYWLHRALHHYYLYSRYHSHHHSSIVTEPITCASPHHTCVYAYIAILSCENFKNFECQLTDTPIYRNAKYF